MVLDMLWSDPDEALRGVDTNPGRGKGIKFGPDVVEDFLKSIAVPTLIRSHECVQLGCKRVVCDDPAYCYWTVTLINAI